MEILKWIWLLLCDQRGEIGDEDGSAGDSLETGDEGGQDDPDEDYAELDLELSEEDEDGEKTEVDKKTLEELQSQSSKLTDLQKQVEKLTTDKANLNKALHEARQEKKKEIPDKGDKLSESQLRRILADNKDDPDTLFNMVKYLAETAAEGKAGDAVRATEVARRQKEQKAFLSQNYPKLYEDGSEIRLDVEKTKESLGISENPYGDYFAVASRVLEDLPKLLQTAFKQGEESGLGKKAEDKRQEKITGNKLPKTSVYGKVAEGLTDNQVESARQMGLSPSQVKYYKQIVGKKPSVVSVGR